MITKLTKEQENKLPEFVDKWVSYASEPIDYKRLKKSVDSMYKLMGKKSPAILIARNPYEAVVTGIALQFVRKSEKSIKDNFHSTLHSTLQLTLDSTLYSTLDSTPYSTQSTLYSMLESTLGSTLESTLRSNFENIKNEEFNIAYNNSRSASYTTQWWSFWAGYYDFAKYIGVKFDNEKYEIFTNFLRDVTHCVVLENVFIVSQKPKTIHWLKTNSIKGVQNRTLHRDGGASVEYEGDFKVYSLNGVSVPEYLAMTKESDLDIEWWKKQKNADVKAEFIRKFGMERMSHLGKKIDSYKNYSNEWYRKSEYELIDMSPIFQSVRYAPHLKMKNLTTGTWHLEGVSPECRTIDQAIQFRCNGKQTTIKEIV